MAARRRRGEEEDLSEGEEVESKEAEAISDTEGKAGLVDSASEDSDDYSDASETSKKDEDEAEPEPEPEPAEDKQPEPPQNQEKESSTEVEKVAEGIKELAVADEKPDENQDDVESDAKSANVEEDDLEEEETEENVVSETESQKQRNEDEDERHPAYIPRKGLFFLHDDRVEMTYDEEVSGPKMDQVDQSGPPGPESPEEESDQNEENEKDSISALEKQENERQERARKKLESRAAAAERWSHDKFDDEQQSVQELVDRYGFDIRELDPTNTDFSRPMNHNGTPLDDSMSESSTKRVRGGANRGNRGKPKENSRNNRNNRRSNENKRENRGEQRREKQSPQIKNNKDFPELGKAENFKKNERNQRRNDKRNEKEPRNNRKENGTLEDVSRENKPPRRASRAGQNDHGKNTVKENGIDEKPNHRQNRKNRNQRGENRDFEKEKPQPENRRRQQKQEQRRRVENERGHVRDEPAPRSRDERRESNRMVDRENDQYSDNRRRQRPSPPRKRIEDPAPPIRQRRYSSDLSDEDFSERRRPPPPRRRKVQNQTTKTSKVQLQVEVANVADILAKQGYESQRTQSRKNYGNNDGNMRNHNTSSPSKDRRYREDDRKSERRKQREPDQRNKHRPDEKGSKRYSARTRPEHWGSRQSPSPINDQNFNDHLNAPPQEDPLQDALGKHFNVSAAQAKKFIMQIKNQLHTPVGASGDPAFPISTPTTNTASSNFVDSKPTTAKLQNNIGIRDRTNEQTLAFQAYQSQLQAQYLQQQQQQQSNQPTSQGMQINNDAALQEMVSRQMQQEQFSRQQQPVGVANPYFQQQSATLQYDNATLGQIGNQGYVNPSAGGLNAQVLTQSQQAQLNSLIQNGTTYFQQIDGKRNY